MSDSLTPWTTAHQAPLSFTVSQGLLKLMSIELVMPSNHHIYCFNYKCAAAAAAKSLQSCLTLCDPIDDSLPGSAVPGILQARTLEWVAIAFCSVLTVSSYLLTAILKVKSQTVV